MILNSNERNSLYGVPTLTEAERTEYFTFNDAELKVLYSFKSINSSIYYATGLVFFKLRYTLIDFTYREVTKERQHIMQRYFPNKPSPRTFPTDKDAIGRIEKKILASVDFSRFKGKVKEDALKQLKAAISLHPRQRQLCQAFLNFLIKNNIAIPSYSTVCDTVSTLWNDELARLTKAYYRYSTKSDRKAIYSLLVKTDDRYRIISIRKDMKDFTTQEVRDELDKHGELKVIFLIARKVLPTLKLPKATVNYYAQLINYYNPRKII